MLRYFCNKTLSFPVDPEKPELSGGRETRSQLNGVFVIKISATRILLKVDDIRLLKKLENACRIFP